MAAPDLQAERHRLIAALRQDGATDDVVVQTGTVLAASWPATVAEMVADPLLLAALRGFPLAPVWFEQRMTAVRQRLLYASGTPGAGPLLAALALQGQLNEYAWAEDAAEGEHLAYLMSAPDRLTPEQAMAIASYRPLADLPFADALLARGWTGPVQAVLEAKILAVREERAIAAALPTLTPLRPGVSQDVRAQYEANPYPRWSVAPRVAPLRDILGRPAPPRPKVLVAGCGTGRQAIQAAQSLDAAHTLAVDISRASLAYAVRQTREAGVERMAYAQADLLELPSHYPEAFDVITCAGVLHHMADPFEGARALVRMLKPGGFLNLGLYSAAARAPLEPARRFAAAYTPQTLRELRRAIIAAPPEAGLQLPLQSRDFYATSGCRDLLMHVQEHQLGVDDLQRMLAENGLRFLGFILPERILAAYRAVTPEDPAGRDLEGWRRFEAQHPETFLRMYQFWAEKAG